MVANYDEIEDFILGYNDTGVIGVDDALLLHDIQEKKNHQFPYCIYKKIDLGLMQRDAEK